MKGTIIKIIIIILIATTLFAILQPGGVVTIPGNTTKIAFFKKETNWTASIVHTIIYFIAISGLLVINRLILTPTIDLIFGI